MGAGGRQGKQRGWMDGEVLAAACQGGMPGQAVCPGCILSVGSYRAMLGAVVCKAGTRSMPCLSASVRPTSLLSWIGNGLPSTGDEALGATPLWWWQKPRPPSQSCQMAQVVCWSARMERSTTSSHVSL